MTKTPAMGQVELRWVDKAQLQYRYAVQVVTGPHGHVQWGWSPWYDVKVEDGK